MALVKRQGIEVKAINFYTGLCITETQRRKGGRADGTVPRNEALRAAADLEVDVEYVDISGRAYLDMLVNPRYGYGANANPCVDCRVFMMRRAREIMGREGADFVFTGEVLGQRPKSQRRDTLRVVERDERPRRAAAAPPLGAGSSSPPSRSRRGWSTATRLLDISGRSRHPADGAGPRAGDRPSGPSRPGGCCYLTDESFARKFFDVLDAREAAGEERRVDAGGRGPALHRPSLPPLAHGAKLIVGRSEVENALLERYAEGRARLEAARDLNGPVALVEGAPTWEERQLAARIVARYGKGRELPEVAIDWREEGAASAIRSRRRRDEARIESMRV